MSLATTGKPQAKASRIFSREPPPIRKGAAIAPQRYKNGAHVGHVGMHFDIGRVAAALSQPRRRRRPTMHKRADGSAARTAGNTCSSNRRAASRFGLHSKLPRKRISFAFREGCRGTAAW